MLRELDSGMVSSTSYAVCITLKLFVATVSWLLSSEDDETACMIAAYYSSRRCYLLSVQMLPISRSSRLYLRSGYLCQS